MIDQFEKLKEEFIRRGVPATLDPRNLTVPGAVITLDRIGDDNALCGDVAMTAQVMLVAADTGHPAALNHLLTMYDKVKDLTTGAQASTFTWSDVPNLPALTLNPIPLEND
ncbi:hypothetical protein [Corynebacterium auriscanis]|uniref:hypothetical protein n=1 Tax=Corynebacterium auriscanis TaxID=99807 RepID=UPI0024AC98A5|nr:hypothetical protein [Corynebacterium auriscanis]